MNKIKNYGFVPSPIDASHWMMLGASNLLKTVLQADGNWKPYMPVYEGQADVFETYGCTVFGTLNAYETLMKRKFGGEYNFSERFIYILANLVPPGSDPHLIAETIRKKGLIKQETLPMTSTLEEFKRPNPLTKELLTEGEKFLAEFGIGNDWVFTNNPSKEARIALLKEALTYSPVCVSVTAWYEKDGLFIDTGQPNTHWCLLVDLEKRGDEYYPIVLDSYDLILYGKSTQALKTLHPDHRILMAKRYGIEKQEVVQKQIGIIKQMLIALGELLGILKKNQMDNIPPVEIVAPVVESKPIDALVDIPQEDINQKYLWGTPEEVRHSCRVIMDEEGLMGEKVKIDGRIYSVKDFLCAVVKEESRFNPQAKGSINDDSTRDYGLCQFNTGKNSKGQAYWIGPGADFKDIDEVLNDPEKNIRIFIREYKKFGYPKWWSAYKSGAYKKWL